MTVLTVTLNAAIDKRYDVAGIEVGQVQRVVRVLASAGGKGLNASRGALLCGQRVIATGFVAGFAGQFVTSQVAELGMQEEFVRVTGETRTCINIIDSTGRSTEFLEPGVTVTAAELAALQARFEALLPEADVVTMSGSAPSGCPEDVYVPLIQAARRAGKPVILDTSGALLRAGLAAGPTVIKPNREELSALAGRELDDFADVVAAARTLLEPDRADRQVGPAETTPPTRPTTPPDRPTTPDRRACRDAPHAPEWVVVSLGADGALAVSAEQAVQVHGLAVPAVNPVGCGDVLVGGLAAGLAAGLHVNEALPMAVRVSAAAAAHPETGRFDPDFAESLRLVELSPQPVEFPPRLVEPVETTPSHAPSPVIPAKAGIPATNPNPLAGTIETLGAN